MRHLDLIKRGLIIWNWLFVEKNDMIEKYVVGSKFKVKLKPE